VTHPLTAFLGFFDRWRAPRETEPEWGEPFERRRDLETIAVAYRCRSRRSEDSAADRTWRDLALDAAFSRVDRCLTSIGQQALYRRLREPAFEEREIREFDRRVRAFGDDEGLRGESGRALQPLTKNSTLALAPVLYGARPSIPRGAKLFPAATIATLVAGAASFVWPAAILAVLACALASIAVRFYIHDVMSVHGTAMASLVDLLAASQQLVALQSQALRPELRALEEALAQVAHYRTAISWLTVDRLRIGEMAASVLAYLNVFLLLDVHAFIRSLHLVHRHGPSLARLFETVGEIDAARSVASFRAGTRTCTPTFTSPGSAVIIDGVVHPLVENAVPNDVWLETPRGWLVMGSNMSGKSTFLRAIALNAWLAQSIGCVTARSYAAPLLSVRTLMYVEDDVLTGTSHFLAEARAARDMLLEHANGVDRLCILDELFRGTNTADRVAAAGAFLRALHRDGAFVMVATHDAELSSVLSNTFRPHYFQEDIVGSTMTFDYRLREGPMAPRNALAVLELVGFPAEVLTEARLISDPCE
jgi:hypothetical protein